MSVGVNAILTTLMVVTDSGDGFVGLVYVIITIPLLIISLLFLLVGLIFKKFGRTINYKK